MQEAIKLKRSEVPESVKSSGYKGNKFLLVITSQVSVPSTANVWDSGSRDTYSGIELETGRLVVLGSQEAPWSNHRSDRTFTMIPGIVVIRHTVFQGKDLGITIYAHPDNVRKFIKGPAKPDFD